MFDLFKSLFRPERPSSATAKERLRLVLLSDHISLSPQTIESLKADLLEVISRYVEIDSGSADVTFEHREHEIAMLASVPITGLRDNRPQPPPGRGGGYEDDVAPEPADAAEPSAVGFTALDADRPRPVGTPSARRQRRKAAAGALPAPLGMQPLGLPGQA